MKSSKKTNARFDQNSQRSAEELRERNCEFQRAADKVANWIDGELKGLEERFAGFRTSNSLKNSFGR